eukprot:TRINITY_DN12640_c0_g1_i8.p1 TRINITY_DN12640_c0_g1~~TRINITY_DN12640_c0_g1_i8.p1  ORF type:complete len:1102 (+),score=299.08 TRINITY_DN12640_c0_g1_i8:468-3308(+)
MATAVIADIGTATALDIEGESLENVTCSHMAGDTFAMGETTVLCTATDKGKTGKCSYTITVVDQQTPVMQCPSTLSFDANQNQDRTKAQLTGVSVSDNVDSGDDILIMCRIVQSGSDPVALDTTLSTELAVGDYTAMCTAKDQSDNMANCSIDVSVLDTQAPNLTCPTSLKRDSGPAPAVSVEWNVNVRDNVPGSASVECSPNSDSSFAVADSPHTVTCTATDGASNTAQCVFQVTILDTGAPNMTCPDDQRVDLASSVTTTTLSVSSLASATDNSGTAPSIVCDPADGTSIDLGRTKVTCTATDAMDLTSSCSFDVVVVNPDGPVLACPDDVLVNLAPGETSASPEQPLPIATAETAIEGDVTCDQSGTAPLPAGTTMVTCTAKDAESDATGTCTYNVIVRDTVPPVFDKCPSDTSVTTGDKTTGVLRWMDALNASDAFSDEPVTVQCSAENDVTQAAIGFHQVRCTATDTAGNSADNCLFEIEVIDNNDPVLVCEDITLRLPEGSVNMSAGAWQITAVDNSNDNLTVACDAEPSTEYAVGNADVSCTTSDTSGNQAQCSFTVAVMADCIPEWGAFSECSACPQPFRTRSRVAFRRPAANGGRPCQRTDIQICDLSCLEIVTGMRLTGVQDVAALRNPDVVILIREAIAEFLAGRGFTIELKSIGIDPQDIVLVNARRAGDTVDIPYTISVTDDKAPEMIASVDEVSTTPALLRQLLDGIVQKVQTSDPSVFDDNVQLAQSSARLSSDPAASDDKDDDDTNVGLIVGIIAAVAAVGAIVIFVAARRSSAEHNVAPEVLPTQATDTIKSEKGPLGSERRISFHQGISPTQDVRNEEELDINIFTNPTYRGDTETEDNFDRNGDIVLGGSSSEKRAISDVDQGANFDAQASDADNANADSEGGYLDVDQEDEVDEDLAGHHDLALEHAVDDTAEAESADEDGDGYGF